MNYLFLASFGEISTYILYILLAILVLMVMITVHELGHFIMGKILGFGIEEFAIGFGPKIFSKKKKNGEVFSLRLIPLGGFCSFKGEDKDDNDPKAFNNKKPWQRILVLVSGAFMNYVLAIFVISLMFGVYGHSAIMAYDVNENTEYSSEYTLKDRDVFLEVNGKKVYLVTDLIKAIGGASKGDIIPCYVLRNGEKQNVEIKLLADANYKNLEDLEGLCTSLGINYTLDENGAISTTGFRSTGIKLGFFENIGKSFEYSFKLAGTVFSVLGELITGSLGIKSLGGTVTTISVTADAIKAGGLWSLLNITAFIGVNLAVFNLLPIPALDGSRVVFTTIEWIRRKPLNRRVESIIHAVGFVLIVLFAIFIDLQQCF